MEHIAHSTPGLRSRCPRSTPWLGGNDCGGTWSWGLHDCRRHLITPEDERGSEVEALVQGKDELTSGAEADADDGANHGGDGSKKHAAWDDEGVDDSWFADFYGDFSEDEEGGDEKDLPKVIIAGGAEAMDTEEDDGEATAAA